MAMVRGGEKHLRLFIYKEDIVMNAEKRKALEAAGWRFGEAADFLEMTNEERQLHDARMEAALAVRRLRKTLKLSQKQSKFPAPASCSSTS
jgi:hypothetical protein